MQYKFASFNVLWEKREIQSFSWRRSVRIWSDAGADDVSVLLTYDRYGAIFSHQPSRKLRL